MRQVINGKKALDDQHEAKAVSKWSASCPAMFSVYFIPNHSILLLRMALKKSGWIHHDHIRFHPLSWPVGL